MRLGITLLALASPLAVLGDLRHIHRRTNFHAEVAKRAEGHIQLFKRFDDARWTYYDVGGAADACGEVNSPDQFIVALNSAQYGNGYPGPNCFKKIIMQFGGKQATATITDECPGCPSKGLDLTTGLFKFFADLDVGVLDGTWWFADEAPPSPTLYSPPKTTTAKPKPTATHQAEPTTTTTVKPKPSPVKSTEAIKGSTPKTSSTSSTPPTSSTSSTSSTSTERATSSFSSSSSSHSSSSSLHPSSVASSSASSSVPSSSATSGFVVPTSVANNGKGQNILTCNQALIGLGELAAASITA